MYVKSVSVIMRNQIIDRDSGLPLVLLEASTNIHTQVFAIRTNMVKDKSTTLVYVGNTKTNALVDTGADTSVMRKQFLDKTGFTNGQLEPASCKTIIAVNGQHVRILGKIQLCISNQSENVNDLVHVFDYNTNNTQKLHSHTPLDTI